MAVRTRKPLAASPPNRGQDGRLTPERFRRIGQLVERIAQEPGSTRRRLAQEFHLSERRLQADLGIIRQAMRLPLARRRGYRFVGAPERGTLSPLSPEDGEVLLALVRQSAEDKILAKARVQAFASRALSLFPARLQPMLQHSIALTLSDQRARGDHVFPVIAGALIRGDRIQIHYAHGERTRRLSHLVVAPELLMPYLGSWLLLGHCEQLRRPMLYDLARMSAVTVSGGL